jgi:DNA polymerase beta
MLIIGGHYDRSTDFISNNKKNMKKELIKEIGNSILECIRKNNQIGANAIQTFMGHHYKTTLRYKTPLSAEYIQEIKRYLKKTKMEFIIHAILTLNFCNPTKTEPHYLRYAWGIENVIYDIETARKFVPTGPLKIAIHLGTTNSKHYQITEEECYKRYVKNLLNILKELKKKKVNLKGLKILMETNAGEGSKIAKTIDHLQKLWSKFPQKDKQYFGFCIDTAHIFSAGYPIHTVEGAVDFIHEWSTKIGLDTIQLIHLNDSIGAYNEHRDKHIQLTEGYIYSKSKGGDINALKPIISMAEERDIPIILETREENRYKEEIEMVKRMLKKTTKKEKESWYKTKTHMKQKKTKISKKRKTKILKKQKRKIQKGGINKIKKDYRDRIIEIFRELGTFHQSMSKKTGNGSSVFRAKSYTSIVKNLEKFDEPIYSIKDVENIPGIGKSTLLKIQEIIDTGNLKMYQEILKDPYYKSLKDLQRITGIGPETAENFIEQGINSVDELKKEWLRGKIKLTHIQEISIKYLADLEKKIPRKEITEWQKIISQLLHKHFSKTVKVVVGGSYRMGKKESSDIDIILCLSTKKGKTIDYNRFEESAEYQKDFDKIVEILQKNKLIIDEYWKGTNKWMGIVQKKKGLARHMDLRWIPEKYEETYLLYFGSGVIFSRYIRSIAKEKGFKLTEWGLYDLKKKKYLDIYSEEGIFKKLGLEYISPEKR